MNTTALRSRVASLAAEGVYDNAVVVKELRTRMRGTKAFLAVAAYVLLLAVVLLIVIYDKTGWTQAATRRTIGMDLFIALTWAQAILLTLIVPALTSNSLTAELEHKTIELLSLTRLSAGKIVVGKQLSGFLYALTLLVCSAPLAALCLAYGGVSPLEIAVVYALLVAWAFLFACVGVFWSSLFNRTSTASMLATGTCVLYFLATLLWGLETVLPHMGRLTAGPFPFRIVLDGLNPAWAAYAAFSEADVCGLKVPIALTTSILHIAFGVLALLIASTHLRHRRVERALSIRLLLLAVTAFLTWLIVGNVFGQGYQYYAIAGGPTSFAEPIQIWATLALCAAAAGAIVMATGEIKGKGQTFLAYVLAPRLAFKSDLRGAMTFLVIWAATTYAVFGATFYWLTQAYSVSIPSTLWTTYLKVGIALLVIVAAIAAIGVLASAVCRHRREAAAIVVLAVLLLFVGYPVIGSIAQSGGPYSREGLAYQVAALWPLMPIFQTTEGQNFYGPEYWWSPSDAWMVSCIVYVLITMAALGLASAASRKWSGVRED